MIEIHGAGLHNKGAHLMLLTAMDKLTASSPDVRCCVEPSAGPYVDRASCGLFQIFPPGLPGVSSSGALARAKHAAKLALGKALGARMRRVYGLALRSEVDALVDVSGYRLGDAWGSWGLRWMAALTGRYRRQGKPVVLLPQMFGPFTKPGTAALFRKVLDNADLVYAREPVSLEHVRSAGGRADHVRLAPDITIFAEPAERRDPALPDRDYACIVPNMRVLDKAGDRWGQAYMEHLEGAARRLAAAGLDVHVVVHDQEGDDSQLARQLLDKLGGQRCRLCCEAHPLRMKAYLSGARVVVGSRFHALVGALSCGVPVVALGWAHKYEMLLQDFGVPEFVHSSSAPADHLLELVERLLDDEAWGHVHRSLQDAKQGMAAVNRRMWHDVLGVLGLGKPGEEATPGAGRGTSVEGREPPSSQPEDGQADPPQWQEATRSAQASRAPVVRPGK